jgi:hypothetical protein
MSSYHQSESFFQERYCHDQRSVCLAHRDVDFSQVIDQFITRNHIFSVQHPPYIRDLARLEYWHFGHMKNEDD